MLKLIGFLVEVLCFLIPHGLPFPALSLMKCKGEALV